jgi:hypothetical protein
VGPLCGTASLIPNWKGQTGIANCSWHRKRLQPGRKPNPRASGSRLALHRRARKYRRAARLGCSGWGSVVAWSSTAATTGFVRGHRAPVTTNNRRTHLNTTETPTTDAHVCANGPIFHLSPGPARQNEKSQCPESGRCWQRTRLCGSSFASNWGWKLVVWVSMGWWY